MLGQCDRRPRTKRPGQARGLARCGQRPTDRALSGLDRSWHPRGRRLVAPTLAPSMVVGDLGSSPAVHAVRRPCAPRGIPPLGSELHVLGEGARTHSVAALVAHHLAADATTDHRAGCDDPRCLPRGVRFLMGAPAIQRTTDPAVADRCAVCSPQPSIQSFGPPPSLAPRCSSSSQGCSSFSSNDVATSAIREGSECSNAMGSFWIWQDVGS